jgi:hypothetical protein
MKFAGGTERGFQPKAGQVKDSERTGGAGADKWYDIAAHINSFD